VSYEAWIRKALRFREYAEEDLRSGRYDFSRTTSRRVSIKGYVD
jgi:HEPN domain-containing protein